MYVTYGLRALTLCICISMGFSESPGRACYHAKICVHNAMDKCGIDSKGTVRRFLDSCDMKEYNCLKRTDFVKTNDEKCKSLPLMDVKERKEKKSLSTEISKTDAESMALKPTKSVSKSHQGIKIIINTNAQQIGPDEENGTEQEDNTEEEQEDEEVEEETNLDDEEVKSNEASKVNDDVDDDNNTDHDSLREEDNISEASDALEVNAKDSDNQEQSANGE